MKNNKFICIICGEISASKTHCGSSTLLIDHKVLEFLSKIDIAQRVNAMRYIKDDGTILVNEMPVWMRNIAKRMGLK